MKKVYLLTAMAGQDLAQLTMRLGEVQKQVEALGFEVSKGKQIVCPNHHKCCTDITYCKLYRQNR